MFRAPTTAIFSKNVATKIWGKHMDVLTGMPNNFRRYKVTTTTRAAPQLATLIGSWKGCFVGTPQRLQCVQHSNIAGEEKQVTDATATVVVAASSIRPVASNKHRSRLGNPIAAAAPARHTKSNQKAKAVARKTKEYNDILHNGIQQEAQREIKRARKVDTERNLVVPLGEPCTTTSSPVAAFSATTLHPLFDKKDNSISGSRDPREAALKKDPAARRFNDENWHETVDRLLNRSIFPVGFSSHSDCHFAKDNDNNSWFDQVEHVLNETTPRTIVQALELIDRWGHEQKTARTTPSFVPRILPVATINWVMQCWSTRFKEENVFVDAATALSPEAVWAKLIYLHVDATTTPNETGTILSTILETIGHIEAKENAPYRGEALLQYLLNDESSHDAAAIVAMPTIGYHSLNTASVNSLMQLWYQSRLTEAAPAAVDRLLNQLNKWYQLSHRADQCPDDVTLATVVATYTAMSSPGAAVHRAGALLRHGIVDDNDRHAKSRGGFVLYSTIIEALAKAGHVERAHKMLNAFLARQERLVLGATASTEKEVVVPMTSFEGCHPVLSILQAYRRRVDRQPTVARAQMERFVAQMEPIANKNTSLQLALQPNAACYAILMDAYTHLRSPRRAEGLLRHVLRLQESNEEVLVASGESSLTPVWNGVLQAWAHSGDAETVPRVSALIRSMEERSTQPNRSCQPNPQTYNILLFCLVNDRRNTPVENARAAHEFLQRMERGDCQCRPTGASYDLVLLAWCKAGYPDQADLLLQRFCRLEDADEARFVTATYPASQQFVTVMHGYAKIARRRNGQHRVLERVEWLLQTMHSMHARGYPTKPSLTAYNIFLECLVKSHEADAPERAESFLRLLEREDQSDDSLIPDAVVYNSILTAWYRSNRSDAPIKAALLFSQMKAKQAVRGNVINAFTYTTLMGIYAQHMQPKRAQEMFEEMLQACDPSSKYPFLAYSTMIHAWAVAGKPEAAFETVERLHQEYTSRALYGPSKGATLAFNALLQAWTHSSEPDATTKAECCLDTMHLLASSGKFHIRPNLASYSAVIQTLARSGRKDAGRRAFHIFYDMKARYVATGDPSICPDLNVYVDLIAALAQVDGQGCDEEAPNEACPFLLDIQRLLDEVDSLVHPSCWQDQGKRVLSRVAWNIAESKFGLTDKIHIMRQVQRLAMQHSVKLDHTIALLFKQFSSTGDSRR